MQKKPNYCDVDFKAGLKWKISKVSCYKFTWFELCINVNLVLAVSRRARSQYAVSDEDTSEFHEVSGF